MRRLSYSLAINEALYQMMESDASVFLIGQGVKSPWYVGNTSKGLLEKFGAALVGMRPVVVHPRVDFMMYAMDPVINEAANWHYMFGGKLSVPVVIWGIINRGGEQAAQHSQSLHALFAHIPGLKVVMPSTPYDAKGLMISAIKDDNPVVYMDDRWLYPVEEEVPEEIYSVPIGKGVVRNKGRGVTLAAISYMVGEAIKASVELEKEGIDAEVIDLRTVKPLDEALLFDSVRKTGRLVVVDGGWRTCGMAADVSARVSENIFEYLKAPIKRVTLPDSPAPASGILEKEYYSNFKTIFDAVKAVLRG